MPSVCRDSCGVSYKLPSEASEDLGKGRQMTSLLQTDEVDDGPPGSWLPSHLMFSDAVRYCAVAGEGSPTVRYRAEGD